VKLPHLTVKLSTLSYHVVMRDFDAQTYYIIHYVPTNSRGKRVKEAYVCFAICDFILNEEKYDW